MEIRENGASPWGAVLIDLSFISQLLAQSDHGRSRPKGVVSPPSASQDSQDLEGAHGAHGQCPSTGRAKSSSHSAFVIVASARPSRRRTNNGPTISLRWSVQQRARMFLIYLLNQMLTQ